MSVKGYLFDLDGTIYVGDSLIAGACELIDSLKAKKIPYLFVTNTSTKSRANLVARLNNLGLAVDHVDILTACHAGALYLRAESLKTCYLLVQDAAKEDFADCEDNQLDPQCVVVGDLAAGWTFERMNTAFRLLMQGARLIALHKGRYFQGTKRFTNRHWCLYCRIRVR